jgi:non-ribosomal peptide synthetase component E (peptide arylation enzyme)
MEGLEKYDLASLKKISVGGAPSTPDLVRAVYDRLKCVFINGFGSSEGTNMSTRPDDNIDVICNSVGKPACPYDSIRIIDDAGNEVLPGVEGELVSKGPGVFTGYFRSQEENSRIFTPDGYFKTGDKARKDRFGNITITGRIKDIINRGGEKISALEIENRMSEHSAIQGVAVVGMPDPVLGERICAYVSLVPGARISGDAIITFLKDNGSSVQQLPEKVVFLEELPTTKVGKIDKNALREDIRKRLEGLLS